MATSEKYCETNLAVKYGTYFNVNGTVKRKTNGEIEFKNIQAVVTSPQYLQVNLTIYVWYTSNMNAPVSVKTDATGTTLNGWTLAKSKAISLNNYVYYPGPGSDSASLGTFTVNPNTTGPVKVAFGYWASSYYDVNLGGGSNVYNVGEASEFFNDNGGLVVPYKAVSGLKMSSSEIGTNSFKISASWTAGVESDGRVYVTTDKTGDTKKLIDDDPVVFDYNNDSIKSNTYYTVTGRLCDKTHDSSSFETLSLNLWTKPIINNPTLTRRSGFEHNTIDVSVSAAVSTEYDQFAYKIGSGNWSDWTTDKTYSFSGLTENTEYTISAKMKNTESGYESEEKTNKITTWYDPISNLSVVLLNRWFWYLLIKSNYTYHGTISKYEFSIGNEAYQNKGTTNSYSKGTTTPGNAANLAYNTDFTCKAKLTDNHGRTAEASATFKTLDERPLYVDGVLREVKVINSDGTVTYVTPNLLSVINSDGTITNMNKIINNDNRTQYQ